jgi:predicted enzyme related to lactoylglutathione lyase
MPIAVKEVAFIFHSVKDVPAARKFYEEVLGLKVGMQVELSPGVWWIEYDVAGVTVGISNSMRGRRASSLVLEVADLDAALTTAREAGVPITTEILDFPPCRMFQIKDPDGNEISLHQRKVRS